MRLVLVKWLDAFSRDRWHDAEPDTEGMFCETVGFLTHDGPKAKTIAGTKAESDERSCEMTIPNGCILSIVDLIEVLPDETT